PGGGRRRLACDRALADRGDAARGRGVVGDRERVRAVVVRARVGWVEVVRVLQLVHSARGVVADCDDIAGAVVDPREPAAGAAGAVADELPHHLVRTLNA